VLNKQDIKATTLGDAWFQTLFRMLNEGSVFKIDRGSYAGQKRLEFDYVDIHISHPGERPLLPQIEPHYGMPNPVADDYLDDYLPYLMTGELKEGESYTYGQRLTNYPLPKSFDNYKGKDNILILEYEKNKDELKKFDIITTESKGKFLDGTYETQDFLDQIELLIWTYKNKGFRNNQMVLQVAHPSDMLIQDPPCLRHIDTRIQDGKLHFYPYFRSWDLWGGFPANLAAIQLLKEYVAAEIGVEDGEMIASSKGLHIYDYAFDLAKCLRMQENIQLKGE
jgi:thymidylate synthase